MRARQILLQSATFPRGRGTAGRRDNSGGGASSLVGVAVNALSSAIVTPLRQWKAARRSSSDGSFGPPNRQDEVNFDQKQTQQQQEEEEIPESTTEQQQGGFYFPTSAELLQQMTPSQRWYRRQFHEQHLVCSTADVRDALLMIAASSFQKEEPSPSQQAETVFSAATRVVDALVGAVDTSVAVTLDEYLDEVAPKLPPALHAAVVCDLLVKRRQSWDLMMLLPAGESAAFQEEQVEQRFVRSVKFLPQASWRPSAEFLLPESAAAAAGATSTELVDPSSSSSSSLIPVSTSAAVLEQCHAHLMPFMTRYALHDASVLLDAYQDATSGSSGSNSCLAAVEAASALEQRISEIEIHHHRLQRQQVQQIDDAAATGATIRNQLIQSFAQRGDWLSTLRCWSNWMLKMSSSSSLSTSLAESLEEYNRVNSATVACVAAAWCRVGLWERGVGTLEAHRGMQRAVLQNDEDDTTTTTMNDLLLTHAQNQLSALSFLSPSPTTAESIARSLLDSVPINCAPSTAERDIARRLSCFFSSSSSSSSNKLGKKKNTMNSSSSSPPNSLLFEIDCAAGNWQRALEHLQISNNVVSSSNDKKSVAQHLAASGAPWTVVREAIVAATPAEESARFEELVRTAFLMTAAGTDENAWKLALRLISKQPQSSSSSARHLLDTPVLVSREEAAAVAGGVVFSAKTLLRAGELGAGLDATISDAKQSGIMAESLVAARDEIKKQQQPTSSSSWLSLLTAARRRHALDLVCNVWWAADASDGGAAAVEDPISTLLMRSTTSSSTSPILLLHAAAGRALSQLLSEQQQQEPTTTTSSSRFVDYLLVSSPSLPCSLSTASCVLAAAERVRTSQQLSLRQQLFVCEVATKQNKKQRDSLLVAFEPRDELVLPPLAAWEEEEVSSAVELSSAVAATTTSLDELRQHVASASSVATAQKLLLECFPASTQQRQEEQLFDFLTSIHREQQQQHQHHHHLFFSLPFISKLLVVLCDTSAWSAVAATLRFARTHLKFSSLPLETFTRVVEVTAFALNNNNTQVVDKKQHRRAVTAAFSEALKLSTSAAARASAQRLAARSSHRSSWEEALATLDFAVVVCGGKQQEEKKRKMQQQKHRINSNNNSNDPVVAQTAIWRLATTAAALGPHVHLALWDYLSQLPQPLVMPRKLFDALMATSSSSSNTSIAALTRADDTLFVHSQQSQRRNGRVTQPTDVASSRSLLKMLRRALALHQETARLSNVVEAIESLGAGASPSSTTSSLFFALGDDRVAASGWNLYLRSAARCGRFDIVFEEMRQRVRARFSSSNTNSNAVVVQRTLKLLDDCFSAAAGTASSNNNSNNGAKSTQTLERDEMEASQDADLSLDAFLDGVGQTKKKKKQQQPRQEAEEVKQSSTNDASSSVEQLHDSSSSSPSSSPSPTLVLHVLTDARIEVKTLLAVAHHVAMMTESQQQLSLVESVLALLESIDADAAQEQQSLRRCGNKSSLTMLHQSQRYVAQAELMRKLESRADEAELLAIVTARRFRKV